MFHDVGKAMLPTQVKTLGPCAGMKDFVALVGFFLLGTTVTAAAQLAEKVHVGLRRRTCGRLRMSCFD